MFSPYATFSTLSHIFKDVSQYEHLTPYYCVTTTQHNTLNKEHVNTVILQVLQETVTTPPPPPTTKAMKHNRHYKYPSTSHPLSHVFPPLTLPLKPSLLVTTQLLPSHHTRNTPFTITNYNGGQTQRRKREFGRFFRRRHQARPSGGSSRVSGRRG